MAGADDRLMARGAAVSVHPALRAEPVVRAVQGVLHQSLLWPPPHMANQQRLSRWGLPSRLGSEQATNLPDQLKMLDTTLLTCTQPGPRGCRLATELVLDDHAVSRLVFCVDHSSVWLEALQGIP